MACLENSFTPVPSPPWLPVAKVPHQRRSFPSRSLPQAVPQTPFFPLRFSVWLLELPQHSMRVCLCFKHTKAESTALKFMVSYLLYFFFFVKIRHNAGLDSTGRRNELYFSMGIVAKILWPSLIHHSPLTTLLPGVACGPCPTYQNIFSQHQ